MVCPEGNANALLIGPSIKSALGLGRWNNNFKLTTKALVNTMVKAKIIDSKRWRLNQSIAIITKAKGSTKNLPAIKEKLWAKNVKTLLRLATTASLILASNFVSHWQLKTAAANNTKAAKAKSPSVNGCQQVLRAQKGFKFFEGFFTYGL